MSPVAQIDLPSPTESTVSPPTWKAIPRVEPAESQSAEFLWARWSLGPRSSLGTTTISDISAGMLFLRPAYPEGEKPWYLAVGMDGMRAAVDRMQREARGIEAQARFSDPVVERVGDDEGAELSFVVVDVFIPETVDGGAFRDRLFGRLEQVLTPEDRARLAVGVGRLQPLRWSS